MASYYSFLGIILQAIIMNVLLASSPAEGQNLNYFKINVNVYNVSLEQAFRTLEQNSVFTFSYVKEELPKDARVTLNAEDESLQSILETFSSEYGLTFHRVNDIIVVKNENVVQIIEEGRGSLRGAVVDSLTNEAMIGANVIVLGTSLGAATDIEGGYRIQGIPAGIHRIKISYIGYRSKEFEVRIENSRTTMLNAKLSYNILEGSEVVVSAQLRGQAAAINRQLTSEVAINVVASDKIRELPDANAAESIGRLPGISLTRSGGEANKVVVRGLEPKFNAVAINGVKVPSNDISDRSVDLSMISSEILDGIEVYKATTPDMDAETVGGVVNLKIKKAPQERNVRVKLVGNFNRLKRDYHGPNGVAEYSDRFFDGKLGVVSTINYEGINRSAEGYSAGWTRQGLRDTITGLIKFVGNSISISNTDEIRKRWGGGLTLDYALEDGTIWLTNFYSSTERNLFRLGKSFSTVNDRVQWSTNDSEILLTGLSSSLNGEMVVAGMDLDWVLSRYSVQSKDLYNWSMLFEEGSPFNKSLVNPDDPSTFALAVDDNLNKMALNNCFYSPDSSKQIDYAAAANLKIHFSFSNELGGYLKFGGKYIKSDRDRGSYSIGKNTYYQGGGYTTEAKNYWDKQLIMTGVDKISIKNFISSEVDHINIVNNEYKLFPLFSRDIGREWYNQQKPTFLVDQLQIINNYDLSESVSSAYLMTKLNYGTFLNLITGIRYEYSDNRYSSYKTSVNAGLGGAYTKTDTTRTKQYGYFFPHVHLKIKPLNWFDLRFSISRSLARPNYSWITPWTQISISSATIRRGNPDLIETKVWNYDLSLSIYDNSFGLFTISGFYKQLQDIFYSKQSVLLKPEDIEKFNIPGREGGYIMTSYANSPKASVRGFEIELQTRMSVLPGIPEFMRGFVLTANYSRIWSETYFPYYDLQLKVDYTKYPFKTTYLYNEYERKGPMPGQANQIANLSFGYDIGELSARLSLVYQGASLSSIGTIAEADSWNNAFWRWDASVRYRFTKQFSFYFNLVNISGQPDRGYVYRDIYETRRTYYGMEAKGSIEFEL